MIRRRARKRQPESDVHGAAERRHLDRRHSDVMIWCYDGIKFAAQRPHEDGVGGEWSQRAHLGCDGRQQVGVVGAEPPAVTGVRVQGAECNARLRDVIPVLESFAREADRVAQCVCRQGFAHCAQRQVRRGEHHTQALAGEHHGSLAARELGQQLGVSRRVVTAEQQRMLVQRRGDDSADRAGLRQFHGAHHRVTGQSSGERHATTRAPRTNGLVHVHLGAARSHDEQVTDITDRVVVEHRLNQLRPDAAGIAQCDGEARTPPRHRLQLDITTASSAVRLPDLQAPRQGQAQPPEAAMESGCASRTIRHAGCR